MKELRNRIKEHLKQPDVCEDYYAPENVYKSACLGYIPAGISFPCIGILDGDTDYEYPDGGDEERHQEVDIIIEIPLTDDDESLEASLDATSRIRKTLRDNPLGLDNVETALPVHESGSALTEGPGGLCVRRILTMGYTRTD